MANVHYSKVSRSMRRIKEKVFPQSPQSIDELVHAFEKPHIEQTFGTALDGGKFFQGAVSGDGYAAAIFASTEIIQLIETHIPPANRVYLADATFKIVPVGFFSQLLVVYIAYENEVFPVCYVLMSKKTKIAYQAVFEYIEQHIFKLKPSKMVMDFELAMRSAFEAIYPGVPVLGCWFHHNQAVRRRASRIPGFFNAIYGNPEFERTYRKILKLPLLGEKMIAPAFQVIETETKTKTTAFDAFFKYYKNQWLKNVSRKNIR